MLKTRLTEAISSPQKSLKNIIRSAVLACLMGTSNQGCIVAYASPTLGTGYPTSPSAYYHGMPQPCIPPLPTVTTVGTRPYYFARPVGPTTVVVSPSHPYYRCP